MYPIATTLKSMGLADRRCHKTLRLHPALVEEALRRLGDRRLTTAEQKIVMRLVKDPAEVNWPAWWEVPVDRGNGR